MSDEFLGDRRKALEDQFFSKESDRLSRALKEQEAKKATKAELASASGIRDDTVLEQLLALGIGVETVTALSLVPLIEVAWADGDVDAKERDAILSAADGAGVARGTPSAQRLESWLTYRPGPEILAAWKEYVAAVSATLDADSRRALKTDLLGRARSVAEAAGGFLGLGTKISKSEQAVLDDLERTFR